ncbi:hypothetical protein OG871_04535 [Kitasatospora sp. NBC_00374]|uniref:hypothetical protein n=1 Tax=Kitasatospora sp. NBC_00374 TaxID=2975964 RepID=UPI00324FC4BE
MAGLRVRGVLAAAAAAVVTTVAAPAGAAQDRPAFEVQYPTPSDQQLAPGDPAFRDLALYIHSLDNRSTLTGLQVTVDGRALAKVAELRLPAQCAFTDTAHLQAVCALGEVTAATTLRLGVRASAGAAVGAAGAISYRVTATGASEGGHSGTPRTTVKVADGPDLAARQLPARTTVGGPTPIDTGFVNRGNRDANGVVLYFAQRPAFGVEGSYGNCLYPVVPDSYVLCRFDELVVHPGEALRPAVPVVLAPQDGGNPPNSRFEYGVDVKGGRQDRALGGDPAITRRGTGPALTLTAEPAPSGVEYGGATVYANLETGRVRDLAVVAPDIASTLGSTARAGFGIRNAGDVPVAPGDPAGTPVALLLAFPEGLRVAEAPAGCAPATGGTPGYTCTPTRTLHPDETETFTFQVEPTELFDRRTGTAALSAAPGGADASAADDRAEFRVGSVLPAFPDSPAPAASRTRTGPTPASVSSPGPSPSTSPATAPTNASSSPAAVPGPDLARTGGGDAGLPIALGGAAAVGLGIGLLATALTYRRRAGLHGRHRARPGFARPRGGQG